MTRISMPCPSKRAFAGGKAYVFTLSGHTGPKDLKSLLQEAHQARLKARALFLSWL